MLTKFVIINGAIRIYVFGLMLAILGFVYGGQFASMQTAAENVLLPLTPAPAAGEQQAQISRGANGSLVVWSDNRTTLSCAPGHSSAGQDSGFDIYAARYDANGNLLDAAPIIVSHFSRRNRSTDGGSTDEF